MKVDVFIDLEGIGITFGIRKSVNKVKLIATALPQALLKEGYEIVSISGFACHNRTPDLIPHKIKGVLRRVTEEYKWKIVWSSSIADLALIRAVEDGLIKETLSEAVMIVANDHDFGHIIRRISGTGRTVLVSGTRISKQLQNVADRNFDLWELLGENPEKVDWEGYDASKNQVMPANTLQIPDINLKK